MPLKKNAKKKLNAAAKKIEKTSGHDLPKPTGKTVQFFHQYDVPAAPLTNSQAREVLDIVVNAQPVQPAVTTGSSSVPFKAGDKVIINGKTETVEFASCPSADSIAKEEGVWKRIKGAVFSERPLVFLRPQFIPNLSPSPYSVIYKDGDEIGKIEFDQDDWMYMFNPNDDIQFGPRVMRFITDELDRLNAEIEPKLKDAGK